MTPVDRVISRTKARQGLDARLWELFAYCARYGKQQLVDVKQMPLSELLKLVEEISKLVKAECRDS